MKWFHHRTDAFHSEKMRRLKAVYGFEGIGRYWTIFELVAERMDETDRCSLELPWQDWCSFLSGKRLVLTRFFLDLSLIFGFKVESNDLVLKIEIANLLKMRDNHTKNLQAKCKKVSLDIEIDIDKEKNKTLVHPPKNAAEPACGFDPQKNPENPKPENPIPGNDHSGGMTATITANHQIAKPRPRKSPSHIQTEREIWFSEDWASYPRKAGNKDKARAVYLRTVTSEEKRSLLQAKIQAEIKTKSDLRYVKTSETFFRNWESLEYSELQSKRGLDGVVKNFKPIIIEPVKPSPLLQKVTIPEPTGEEISAWLAAVPKLTKQILFENFETWVVPCRLAYVNGTTAVLVAPNAGHAEIIRENYLGVIEDAVMRKIEVLAEEQIIQEENL